MTNTYKILGQGLSGDLLAPGSTVRKATVYEVPANTKTAVSAINITNSGDEEVTYDLAFVKDADVSLETETVNINIYNFFGFVAASSYGYTGKYSADGVTWQSITFPGTGSFYNRRVAYGNGRYVAMAYDMNGGSSSWSTSIDGINWTLITAPNNLSPKSAKFINNKFFIVFDNTNAILTSEDGLVWTTISPEHLDMGMTSSIYARDIAYGNGMYVLVDSTTGYVYYSPDLLSWTRVYIIFGDAFKAITFGNDKFVAVGGNGFAYSLNGIAWELVFPSNYSQASGEGIVYGNGKFVVNGGPSYSYGTVYYSTDGITWQSAEHSQGGLSNFMMIGNVTYANGLFILGGEYAPLKTSPNGITWTVAAGMDGSLSFLRWVTAGESNITDSYSIPRTLYKHRIVSRKAILPGETQEIKGGITLSAGDQIRVISSADEIITSVYGVEIS